MTSNEQRGLDANTPLPSPQMLGDGEAAIIECLAAGKPFVFDPATNFLHADDGTVEYGIRYVPDDRQPAPDDRVVGAARSFMELFVAESGDERALTVEDIDHTELMHRYVALEDALSGIPSSHAEDDLKERFENACQAASETHSSWEERCRAILSALGFDFGSSRSEVATADDGDLTDCFRHHITTTIGWLAFGARPGPEMQMYEDGFKAGYRRCQSDNEPEFGEEEDALSCRARKVVGKLRESIKAGAVQLADVEDAIDLIIDQAALHTPPP
ncbi:MAG: hypothetical protein AAAB13_20770, partial [Pseudomonas sp.]